jgi:dUTP pyrophosphatase
MNIKPLHSGFIMPTKGSDQAGAFDIYMPEDNMTASISKMVGLGFAAAVPPGYVALLVPRSSVGAKFGLELNNTVGVIDSDYRGEWKAALKTKNGLVYSWKKGDRLLQFLLVPVATDVKLVQVDDLDATGRGSGGFGSSGT